MQHLNRQKENENTEISKSTMHIKEPTKSYPKSKRNENHQMSQPHLDTATPGKSEIAINTLRPCQNFSIGARLDC